MTLRNAFENLGLDSTLQDILAAITDTLDVAVTNFPADQLVHATALPLPAGAATQTTLGQVLTKLNDIFGAVDGLEITAGNIDLSNTTIGLSVDEVESILRQIRDNFVSEDFATQATLEAVRVLLAAPLTVTGPLTNTQLRAADVAVTLDGEDVGLDTTTIEALSQGQSVDTQNTKIVAAADAQPGNPWVGDWTETRDNGVVRLLTVLAATATSVGGIFTFEFSEDGATPTISETRPIGDFETVRDFDLINVGAYYRVQFEPAAPLGSELVFVTTTLRRQDDGAFVRLANQELEEGNASLPSAFSYAKLFDEVTGKSINVRPTFSGSDPENQLTTPLGVSAVWTGEFRDVQQHGNLLYLYAILEAEAPASVRLEYSDDGSTVLSSSNLAKVLVKAGPVTYAVYLSIVNGNYPGKFARPKITNTAVAQTSNPITLFSRNQFPFTGSFSSLDSTLTFFSQALLVRSVQAGTTFAGAFANEQLAEHTVDVENTLITPLTNGAITACTPDDTANDFLSVAHGLALGDAVVFTTTGVMPAPLVTITAGVETAYWVINPTADRFQVTTDINAAVPVAVNLTDVGTGVLSYQKRGQFVGAFKDYSQVGNGLDFFFDAQEPALLRTEWSANGTTVGTDLGTLFATSVRPLEDVVAPGFGTLHVGATVVQTMIAKYRRVRVVNGPNNQIPNFFSLSTFIGREAYPGSFGGLSAALSTLSTALLTRSVQAGITPDAEFRNIELPGRHSANCSTTPLNGNTGGSDHIFRGEWVEWQGKYVGMLNEVHSDVTGTFFIDLCAEAVPVNGDDSTVTQTMEVTYDPTQTLYRRTTPTQSRWVRVRYVNDVTAQADFHLDTAFLTSPTPSVAEPLSYNPNDKTLAGLEKGIDYAKNAEGDYAQVERTGTSRNVYLKGSEAESRIAPLTGLQTRQMVLTSTPQRIDLPVLEGRREVKVTNNGFFHAFVKEDDTITETNSEPLFQSGFGTWALADSEELWGICEDVGGSAQNTSREGSTAGGTATSPSNALTSNDTRSIADAVGETVTVEDATFSFTSPFTDIERLRIGIEARKSSTPATSTAAWVSTGQATGGNVTSLASPSITADADAVYLVAIGRKNAAAATSGVTGMGATWVEITDVSDDNARSRISLWRNSTPVTTTGAVTATFSAAATTCSISVSRCSGVDFSDPIANAEPLTAAGDTASYTDSIDGPNLGLAFVFTANPTRTHAPGSSFVERVEFGTGTGASDTNQTVNTLDLTSAGAHAYSGTFSGNTGWTAIAVTLNPEPSAAPVTTISYERSAVPGATDEALAWSNTADAVQYVDITADFGTIVEADIADLKAIVTVDSIGVAALEVDRVFFEVRETSGATTRISVSQLGVDA